MSSTYVEKLRCTHCGAPLPQPKPGDPYVKCEYCGYVNRVSDSASYAEYLKREVAKWVSQLLPQQIIVSTTADPVARHHVFQAYVKPRLIAVGVNARTRFVETVYRPLLAISPVYKPDCADPKTLFEESVKVEGVSELAISDEDKSFVGDIQSNLLITAHICNSAQDALEEKYSESAKNVEEVLRLVERYEDRVLVARLNAAKSVYTALSELQRRNPLAAVNILRSAESLLNDVSSRREDPHVAKHIAALETEKDLVKLVRLLSEMSLLHFEAGKDPHTPLPPARKALSYAVENAKKAGRPVKELVSAVETWVNLVLSRSGRSTTRVLGSGDFYIPFYVVSTTVTFTTGWFLKKGQETRADVLVSAVPPLLNALVDVFGVYTSKVVNLEKDQDRLATVSRLVESSRLDYLRKPTALPLISQSTAELIADEYLGVVKSKYGGKLKLTTTQVKDLVYVGVSLNDSLVKAEIPLTVFSVNIGELKNIMV